MEYWTKQVKCMITEKNEALDIKESLQMNGLFPIIKPAQIDFCTLDVKTKIVSHV